MTELPDNDYIAFQLTGFSAEVFVCDLCWHDQAADDIQRVCSVLVEEFDEPLGAVNIRLDSNQTVQALNAQFRGKDKPTNVLSFPSDNETTCDSHLGDIILAFETCEIEAKSDDKRFEHHFMHLILHGMLHLLGYDHTNDEEAQEMESFERDILAQLGIPDPYDDDKFEIG